MVYSCVLSALRWFTHVKTNLGSTKLLSGWISNHAQHFCWSFKTNKYKYKEYEYDY